MNFNPDVAWSTLSVNVNNCPTGGSPPMSISPLVCRRAVQHGFLPLSDHVWISDEMLSAAMHRFKLSRSHRRHGSSVPGPLEASRRLAKRRMMGLAVTGGGAGSDLGAILGGDGELKRASWRWEAPAAPGSLDKGAAFFMPFHSRSRQLIFE